MLWLDVLAIVIFFGMFFPIFGLISLSRRFVTADRSKQREKILEALVPPPVEEQGGGCSGKMLPEDHARDANSSLMSPSVPLFQRTCVSSPQLFPMGKASPSVIVSDGLRTVSAPTRYKVSVARMRFLMARHRMSGRGLHSSHAYTRQQTRY